MPLQCFLMYFCYKLGPPRLIAKKPNLALTLETLYFVFLLHMKKLLNILHTLQISLQKQVHTTQ